MKKKHSKKKPISLINEILQYLENELAEIKISREYCWYKGNGRDTAFYVISNTLGHMRSLKERREFKHLKP